MKLYEYGTLVVIRGHPDIKERRAVRVYSEYTDPPAAGGKTYVCVMLSRGSGVGIESKYVSKAKRDTAKARLAWIDEQKKRATW